MLEIFVRKFYKEITNIVNISVFKQIDYLRNNILINIGKQVITGFLYFTETYKY